MKKSIFSKILAGYFVVTVLFSVMIIFFVFRVIKTNYIDEQLNQLRNLSRVIEDRIYGPVEAGKEKEVNAIAAESGEKTGVRITVIAADGRVIADSRRNSADMDNHLNRPEVKSAFDSSKEKEERMGESVRFSNTVNKNMLYSAMPVFSGDKAKWVLRLSYFMNEIDALLNELLIEIIKTAFIVFIFSLAAAYFLARRFLKPVKQLGAAAGRMAEKDFESDLRIETGDEFQEMAESFNFMKKEIKKLFGEITAQREELRTIISSIKEGLLVTDDRGKIKLSNKSFEKIAKIEKVFGGIEGRFYWECMISPRFNELIEKAGKEKTSIADRLEIEGRAYLCSINHLAATDENVIILYDVTGLKEFEEIKKDFVANVSHELKTPLTAIKGFTETLETEVRNEDNLRYIDIIKRHTERLISIVGDLLILSKIEKKNERADFEPVNVRELVLNTVRMFDKKIAEKGLTFNVSADSGLPEISGDEFKLEQMLINIIDNAVKYTEKGEINISIDPADNGINIEVSDTGIGIPEESSSRLFERFYVVDKSRSRKLGGTGLGLSIVKHIVLIHNGKIDIQSTFGKGTKTTVYLPCVQPEN